MIDLQLVSAVRCQMIGHIDLEMEVASTVEPSILAIDVYPGFVVNSSEVQVGSLASPVCRDIERSREPGVAHPATLNACAIVSL